MTDQEILAELMTIRYSLSQLRNHSPTMKLPEISGPLNDSIRRLLEIIKVLVERTK